MTRFAAALASATFVMALLAAGSCSRREESDRADLPAAPATPVESTGLAAATAQEASWGEAVNGLQCRLLPETQTVGVPEGAKDGDPEVFVTYELRNVGKTSLKFCPWYTPLEVVNGALNVIGPDGKPARPLLPDVTRYAPRPESFITIPAGGTHSHRAGVWYDLTQSGKYSISTSIIRKPAPEGEEITRFYYLGDIEKAKQNPDNVWTGTFKSNTVTVNVVQKEAVRWGEAVEGVSARLVADKAQWKAGEAPTLKADFRNNGTRASRLGLKESSWRLEVDGRWYAARESTAAGLLELGPGSEQKGVCVPLDDLGNWICVNNAEMRLLRFPQGKHTIRLRVETSANPDDERAPRVFLFSAPVEIEILPATAATRRVHVFVSGLVQGVGFRAFTAEHAEKRALTGWVKNLDDGRVEAVVEGPTDKVAQLLELLKRGPAAGHVDKLDVADEKPTGEFKSFDVRDE